MYSDLLKDVLEEDQVLPEPLRRLFSEINHKTDHYKTKLKELVSFQSVSKSDQSKKALEWTEQRLKALDISTELKTAENETILFGTFSKSSSVQKKTVLIYGHVDIGPATGWKVNPFQLTERDDKLYGKGVSDNKGALVCWLNAIEAYQHLDIDLPVNLKFIIEEGNETGSVGLRKLLQTERGFAENIHYVCVADYHWLTNVKPSLVHGLRGICYFSIKVQGGTKDLHGGLHGGAAYEPMADLIYLLNTLVDKNGQIEVTGVYDGVAPFSASEKASYDDIEFEVEEYKKQVGNNHLTFETKEQILRHRWREPTLSIHAIEGAGVGTVIPATVYGKFSIRTVPNQTAADVAKKIEDFLKLKWEERGSFNTMQVELKSSSEPWFENPQNKNYQAASKATRYVYDEEPDIVREGATAPVIAILSEATKTSIVLLPIGACDDTLDPTNEKINVSNYINGVCTVQHFREFDFTDIVLMLTWLHLTNKILLKSLNIIIIIHSYFNGGFQFVG